MALGLDLAELLAALGLADALADDVLCGLRGDAAELTGLERGDHPVAGLVGAAQRLRLAEGDLGVLVLPVLVGHHVLHQRHVEGAGLGVDLDRDVVVLDVVVFLDGDDDGRLDLLDQVFGGDAALMLQHGQRFKKFVVACHFPVSLRYMLKFSVRTGPRRRRGGRC